MTAKEELVEFLLNMTPQEVERAISKSTNEEWLATQSDEVKEQMPLLMQLLRALPQRR